MFKVGMDVKAVKKRIVFGLYDMVAKKIVWKIKIKQISQIECSRCHRRWCAVYPEKIMEDRYETCPKCKGKIKVLASIK